MNATAQHKLIKKAEAHVANNELKAAMGLYEKICKQDKTNPNCWLTLGSVAGKLGDYGKAEEAFKKAYLLQNKSGIAVDYYCQALEAQGKFEESLVIINQLIANKPGDHSNKLKAGVLHGRLGNFEDCIALIKEYTQVDSNNIHALHCLASSSESLEKYEDAKNYYKQALRLAPQSHQLHNNYGALLQKTGLREEALKEYKTSLTINNEYPISHYNIASLYYETGKYKESVKHYKHAIEINPNYIEALVGLGKSMHHNGNHDESMQYYRKAIELDNKCTNALVNLGTALLTNAEYNEALTCYNAALNIDPNNIETLCAISNLHERRGEFDTAMKYIEPVLDSPKHKKPIAMAFGLISRKLDKRDEAIERLNSILDSPEHSPIDKSDIHFLIGKLYDEKKEYDKAFEHFKNANELLPHDYDVKKEQEIVNRIKNSFSKEKIKTLPKSNYPSDTPIFIVGMPRSGTTLVEQIIASHPDVYGAGELPYLHGMTKRLNSLLGSNEQFPLNIDAVNEETLTQLSKEYLELAAEYSGNAKYITDKMPHNFRLLGLVELLFPKAKIIHCTRNPVDNCLSLYVNSFLSTHSYTTDLNNAADYYSNYYLALMEHWKNTLSIEILDINYEDLVNNQEPMSRKMLEYCNLDWDDNCLRFYESKRDVATISYDQVRQPIYKKSSERWRNYEKHLQPLIDHFGTETR